MFPLAHRLQLRGNREFFRTAKQIHTKELSAFWLAAPEGAVISQAAIIIKKTAAPLSTQRTALKRKLRAVILPHLKQSPIIHIVFVYKGPLSATNPQIKNHVDNLYAKISA